MAKSGMCTVSKKTIHGRFMLYKKVFDGRFKVSKKTIHGSCMVYKKQIIK